MNLAARKAQARRTLRRVWWLYCAGVCLAGTIGGIIGWISVENDRT